MSFHDGCQAKIEELSIEINELRKALIDIRMSAMDSDEIRESKAILSYIMQRSGTALGLKVKS